MKTTFLLFQFVLFLATLAVGASAQISDCDDTDYDCKVTKYTKEIQADPKNVEAYFSRGLAYLKLKDPDHAIADFNKYILMNPSNKDYLADGYMNRGVGYIRKKNYASALLDLNKAITISAKNPEVFYNRGLVYQRTSRLDLALADYSKYISMNTENSEYLADGYYNRGLVYTSKGNFDLAVRDFTLAIQLSPKSSDYYKARADAYRKAGKIDLAEADEAKAAALANS